MSEPLPPLLAYARRNKAETAKAAARSLNESGRVTELCGKVKATSTERPLVNKEQL